VNLVKYTIVSKLQYVYDDYIFKKFVKYTICESLVVVFFHSASSPPCVCAHCILGNMSNIYICICILHRISNKKDELN